MYGYIKGVVKKVYPSHVIVENNGIGYLIISPNPYEYKLDDEAIFYTYLHVREDVFSLYGFKSEKILNLFLKLISVSGIGPKSALGIVAFDDTDRIVQAIEFGDVKYLTKFPGVGTKSAQQIILDLKGKLIDDEVEFKLISDAGKDVEAALVSLGYNKADIKRVMKHINVDQSADQALKEALAYLLK